MASSGRQNRRRAAAPTGRPVRLTKRRPRREWTRQELKLLATLAKQGMPARAISLKIGRPKTAVVSKARREGILLRRPPHRFRMKR